MIGVGDADLGAVVVAAGASRRMGHPKAELRVGDHSFLEAALEQAQWALAEPIVVVEGAHPLSGCFEEGRAFLCRHPRWADGPLSSLQAGLRHCLAMRRRPEPLAAILVLTVDRPRVTRPTIEALCAARARSPSRIWQPRYDGKSGHPIVWPRAMVDALLQLPVDAPGGPRGLLAEPDVARARAFLDVDDPHVVENIDHPHDLWDV